MKRPPIAVVAAALLGMSTLNACGGDGSDYCNRVRDNIENKTFEHLDLSSGGDVQKFIDVYKVLRSDAPEEIKDDYDAMLKAFRGQQSAALDSANTSIQAYDEDHCDVKYAG
jgi:hypothetical protein